MCEATDSDLSIRYIGNRSKTSDIISESSSHSTTHLLVNSESRRSQSDRTLYDNVSIEYNLIVDQSDTKDVQSAPHHRPITEVTRSKSFNDPTHNQKYLSPPTLHTFTSKYQDKITKSRESSIPSSVRSSLSETNERLLNVPVVDFNSCINQKIKKPDRCKKGNTTNRRNSRSSGHVIGRIFRRMQKISFGWRKHSSKNIPRGELFYYCFFFILNKIILLF